MRSSRGLLSLPDSSASSLVPSRTSSDASLARMHEHGDDLESYLSLVAQERDKRRGARKGEGRGSAAIDWSRLLESQFEEELQDGRNEEKVEIEAAEEYGDNLQFIKPKSKRKEPSTDGKQDTHYTTKKPDGSSSTPKAPTEQPHCTDLTDSISTTVSTCSDSAVGVDKGGIIHQNPPLSRADAEPSEQVTVQEKDTKRDGQNKHNTISQRVSEDGSSSTEDTSDLSLSQDLAFSSHFKNNIFTLDQLEPTHSASDQTSTSAGTSGPTADSADSAATRPQEIGLLHNIVSLADLDSLPAESKTRLVPAAERGEIVSELHQKDTEEDRDSSEEQRTDLNTASEGIKNEDTVTSLSYDEEDFEDETIESTTDSHSALDRTGSTVAEARATTGSGGESGKDYRDHTQTETTASGPDNSGTVPATSGDESPVIDRQVDAERPKNSKKPTSPHQDTLPQNLKAGPGTALPLPTQPPLSLPDFPPLPHHSPHLLTNTTVLSSSAQVSEALEDLVRCQLALTRSLVARSRSLAQHLADSITPDYHYTTLEDTKKYISRHRPRVLTTEEAHQLVSREDNL